jgi:hypothetical protein
MPAESIKDGESQSEPEFGPEVESPEPIVTETELNQHSSGAVSVNLRYYMHRCECFSDWQNRELKKFSNTLEKIRGYTSATLKVNSSLCTIHKGKPKGGKFSRPASISEDIPFHEIKVDPSNKLRIHGFFAGDVFFLVWLDRDHQCFGS